MTHNVCTTRAVSIALTLMLIGCSSAPYQSAEQEFATFTQNAQSRHQIPDVPVYTQEKNQCGAASLATLLNFEGKAVVQNALYAELFVPNKKGTYQQELVALARQYDLLPYARTSHFTELLTEINHNKPTLVLLNLGLENIPVWHYAVVTGFNARKQQLTLHSGKAKATVMSLKRFEKAWRLADYWAISLHPLNHLPTYAKPDIIMRELANFEILGKSELALTGYKNVLKHWPDQAAAYFAIGNSFYSKGRFVEAIDYYQKAQTLSDNPAPILHNLSLAYRQIGDDQQSYQTILQADSLLTQSSDSVLIKRITTLKNELDIATHQ